MLTIHLAATETEPAFELTLEHSLVSLSKWEEHFEKPFYGPDKKTEEETSYYIGAMVVGDAPPKTFVERLKSTDLETITDYINLKRTGTTFPAERPGGGSGEMITNELVYYWMVNFRIPFYPAEHWHFNRLLTLIKVASIKSAPPKKMSTKERAEQYRALNEQRRKEMGSAG